MPAEQLSSFHGMIGRSAAMQALFRRIERVAPIDVPVLIVGESGSGKELAARAIQRLSRRSARRFEIVNCGALTRELLLSELFGHERGAFTGAVFRKEGLLAIADGATVFLDEVGDLPLDAQVMLLRFLQSGEMRAVGSNETRRVNVRLIAATHRDLEAAVERGTFREDLYYRLRRVVLEVPPLRARRDDIQLLVEHILARLGERYELSVRGVTPPAMRALEHYPWRGNVRELEAVLEQAAIFSSGDWITAEDLDLPMPRASADGVASAQGSLSWLQHEALGIASERGEVRRRDIVARCRASGEFARRALVGLVRLGMMRRVGLGRAARYVPLSLWLSFMSDVMKWTLSLV